MHTGNHGAGLPAQSHPQQHHELIDRFAAATNDLLWELDFKTEKFFLSARCFEVLGYAVGECEEVTLEWWMRHVHEEDRPFVRASIQKTLAVRAPLWNCEYRLRKANGSYAWVLVRAVITYGAAGQPLLAYGGTTDITAKKEAEQLLTVSEQRYRTVVEAVLEGVCILDRDYRFKFVNRRGAEILGYSPEELQGMPSMTIIHPADHELALAQRQRRRDGTLDRFECRLLSRPGKVVWTLVAARPLYVDGQWDGELTVLTDITDRKAAESALQHALARLRAIFENAASGIATFDSEGRLIECNAALEKMLGYSASELAGKPLAEITHPEDEENSRRLFAAVRSDPAHHRSIETRYIRKDAQAVWVRLSLSSVRRQDGEHWFSLAVIDDITEEHKANESAAQLARIVETTEDGIFSTSLDGTILSWNRGAERLYGYHASECVGQQAASLLPLERGPSWKDLLADIGSGGSLDCLEMTHVGKSGAPTPVALTMSPITDRGGKIIGVSSIIRNLTEKKKTALLEEQVRQSQKLEAIGRLAGGVAHDLNNMLMVVTSYTELMQEQLEPSSPLQRNAQQVRRAAERAAGITRQLLAFSRKQILSPAVLDLKELTDETLKMIKRLIGEDIRIVYSPGSGPATIEADPGQIVQVLMNLCVNARDAMPQGGELTVAITSETVSATSARAAKPMIAGKYFVLAVRDNGLGMSKEVQTHIFEPFFTTKETGKGTGLGLPTVYGIVKQSGGYIWVTSEEGQGTEFLLYFPAVERKVNKPETAKPVPQPVRGTVLVVEDEDALRQSIAAYLSELGFTVICAADGQQALEKLASGPSRIDILLTDVVMPRVSGRELAEKLGAEHPNLRVVFMTGYTDEAVVRHGLLRPGTVLLQKPFALSVLGEKIAAAR